MVQNWKEVGPHRFRETFGRYFEDFTLGDTYEHRPGKTVTEADNHLFTLLTLNTHPLHFDREFVGVQLDAGDAAAPVVIGRRLPAAPHVADRLKSDPHAQ